MADQLLRPTSRQGRPPDPGRHPATIDPSEGAGRNGFARVLRASRGTRPLPLHPLPSSPFRGKRAPQHAKNPRPPVDTDRGRNSWNRSGWACNRGGKSCHKGKEKLQAGAYLQRDRRGRFLKRRWSGRGCSTQAISVAENGSSRQPGRYEASTAPRCHIRRASPDRAPCFATGLAQVADQRSGHLALPRGSTALSGARVGHLRVGTWSLWF